MHVLLFFITAVAVFTSGACIFVAQAASHAFARIAYLISWWALCAGSLVAGLCQRLA